MSALPITDIRPRIVSVGDALDRLAAMADGLKALKRATAAPQSRAAIDFLLAEVNSLRVALPNIAKSAEAKGAGPRPQSSPAATERRRRDPAWQKKNNEEDGTRYCPRCEDWLPKDQFEVKDPKRGTLRFCCKPCWTEYQRERYVAANKRAIIIEIIEGDEIIGATCNGCGKPIQLGQMVAASVFRHEECMPDRLHNDDASGTHTGSYSGESS